ncbi:hypothetical protein MPER_05663 [Moniliophthora perniciosa FA553]|nr:hypothetical protein MPER_05663 [Moniliophthora perniciosa FA553]
MKYAIGLVRERQVLQQQTAHVRSHLTALDNLLKFTEERIDLATDFLASCDLRLEGHLLRIDHPQMRMQNYNPNDTVRWFPSGIVNPPSPAPSVPPADPISNNDRSPNTSSNFLSTSPSPLPDIKVLTPEPTPESVFNWKLEYPDDTVTFDDDGVSTRVSVVPVSRELGRNVP